MKCQMHPQYKGKSKPRTDCEQCQEIYTIEQTKKQNKILKAQLETFSQRNNFEMHKFRRKHIKIGVLSDTHLGSFYENLNFLEFAYNIYKKEGIRRVYHTGDLIDGEKMYRGHEYEIRVHGADSQIDYCCDVYPNKENITTHFITGNHDRSFWKRSGIDIGKRIAEQRNDMIYFGYGEKDILIGNRYGKIKIRLSHPGKGTAYALSYNPQKYIEALSGGEKPNLVFTGHYHKSEFLPNYRNIALFQAGTLQSQTPYMRERNNAAMVGFWIIEIVIDDTSLIRCRGEFFPYYEVLNE